MGKFTKIMFVVLTTLLVTHGHKYSRQASILRLNYGVIARPLQQIRLLTDEWTHVFVVPLPIRDDFTELKVQAINCSEYNEASRVASCESIQPLLKSFRMLHATARNRIRSTIGHMYELLPDSYVNRQPRGLFDLGSQLLHSVFGVATDQQIQALRSTAIY